MSESEIVAVEQQEQPNPIATSEMAFLARHDLPKEALKECVNFPELA